MVKNLSANARATRRHGIHPLVPSVPWGSGRSPGGGNGNPLQYSYLENSMDRGAWQAIVHGVTKSQIRLNTHTHPFKKISHVCFCVSKTDT